MGTKNENRNTLGEKHFLIAVDESESSKRAVMYTADLLGGMLGLRFTILSIIHVPEPDFFENEEEEAAWIREKTAAADQMLVTYRQVMLQAGIPEDRVRVRSCVNEAKSLSDAILETKCDLSCCTIVVGRQHKTRTEEFLLGSTSSSLIHNAKGCAVWVVE